MWKATPHELASHKANGPRVAALRDSNPSVAVKNSDELSKGPVIVSFSQRASATNAISTSATA